MDCNCPEVHPEAQSESTREIMVCNIPLCGPQARQSRKNRPAQSETSSTDAKMQSARRVTRRLNHVTVSFRRHSACQARFTRNSSNRKRPRHKHIQLDPNSACSAKITTPPSLCSSCRPWPNEPVHARFQHRHSARNEAPSLT